MPEYDELKSAKDMGTRLIADYHPHLLQAKIAYLLKVSGDAPIKLPRAGKKLKYASAAKISDKINFLAGYDFVLEFDGKLWNSLTLEQQTALVDHELEHCGWDEDGPFLKDHDITEFRAIVQRHGIWTDDIRLFVETANQVEALPLFSRQQPDVLTFTRGEVVQVGTEEWMWDGARMILVGEVKAGSTPQELARRVAQHLDGTTITVRDGVTATISYIPEPEPPAVAETTPQATPAVGFTQEYPERYYPDDLPCQLPGCSGSLQRFDACPAMVDAKDILRDWKSYPVWRCRKCQNLHTEEIVSTIEPKVAEA